MLAAKITARPKRESKTGKTTKVNDWRKEIPGSISDDGMSWVFPNVSGTNRNGKETYWILQVKLFEEVGDEKHFLPIDDDYFDNNPMNPEIRGWLKVSSGVVGGKEREVTPTVVVQGKAKRNIFCQALLDGRSAYNKMLRSKTKGVETTPSPLVVTGCVPPMLASPLKKVKSVDWSRPLYLQRKYNGIRAMVTFSDKVILYSRNCIEYPGEEHIKNELGSVVESSWKRGDKLYIDGEVYKHGASLQQMSGSTRGTTKTLIADYMIYDCYYANAPEMTFSMRWNRLRETLSAVNLVYCVLVPTYSVSNEEEVNKLYKEFISEGYEGAMLRIDEKYHPSYNNYHCRALLKVKPELDAEYRVVGWEFGRKGRGKQTVIFVCQTDTGHQFNVTFTGTIGESKELAERLTKDFSQYEGKKIIVTFDELSENGVPLRSRTKAVVREWD